MIHAGRTNDYQTALCGAKKNISMNWAWFMGRRRFESGWKPKRSTTCKKCRAAVKKEKS